MIPRQRWTSKKSLQANESLKHYLFDENDSTEEQNTIAENELKEKVGRLKSISIDIGEEIKGHNVLLSEADNTFDSVGSLLSSTIGKVKLLKKSEHRWYLLFLLLFCFLVLIVLWYLI